MKLGFSKEKPHETLSAMPYIKIDGFTYSRSAHPRWKTGLTTMAVLGPYAISFFFMKGKKHWLTVKCGGEMMAFRLDKGNYNIDRCRAGGQDRPGSSASDRIVCQRQTWRESDPNTTPRPSERSC